VAGFLAGARLSLRPLEALSYWDHVVSPGRWGQDPFLRERGLCVALVYLRRGL